MKKSALCLLLCLLLTLPCLSVAEQSRQVNRSCRIYFANGTELASRLNDGRLLTEVNGAEAVEHTFYIDPNGQTVDAVCVQYGEHILPYVVQAQDAQGNWQQIGAYTGDYAQGYAAFPARSQRFRLVFARDGEKLPLSLRQINVFTPGDTPAIEAREWQPSCEKADLLLIVAHPDDELLWFGGALPTYAGERGMAVQVMYMACNSYLRRLELLCGSRALHYLALNWAQNTAVGRSLSVKPGKTAQAVERLQGELQAVKARCADLEESSFQRLAEDYRDAGNVLLVQPPMESDSVRRLCDAVSRSCGGRCAVFAGADGSYKYAVIHPGQDISPLIKALNAQLHGRGGGRDGFAQGSAACTEEEIRRFWAESA